MHKITNKSSFFSCFINLLSDYCSSSAAAVAKECFFPFYKQFIGIIVYMLKNMMTDDFTYDLKKYIN
ncbi:hypothetical protein QVD17_01692 [Tagetes erecta]|uniref:Uncharacterized protein n=1 Tax=Tagetes erecta TaxID=13708 RepID=A0AAD8P852_TARER|nr:hypothetical protein QVD17_01692 [Tagetes erecta]